MRDVSVLETIQSQFEFSIHLSVIFFSLEPGCWTSCKIQRNVWKVQNTTGGFLAQLHPSKFDPKILCPFQKKVSICNSWIVEKRSKFSVWKLRDIGFPNKYCFVGLTMTRELIELGSPQGFQGTRVHGHRVIYWEQGNKTKAKLGRREQKLWLDMLGNRKHQNHKILLGNKGNQGNFVRDEKTQTRLTHGFQGTRVHHIGSF